MNYSIFIVINNDDNSSTILFRVYVKDLIYYVKQLDDYKTLTYYNFYILQFLHTTIFTYYNFYILQFLHTTIFTAMVVMMSLNNQM